MANEAKIGVEEIEGSLTIGIVAGEVSGDILGQGLICALKERYPNAKFIGIGGPLMLAEGMDSLFDMDEIAVMGLAEILKHLPRLLSIRKQTVKKLTEIKPDIFIGIDAPEFNLHVERKLKDSGIPTIHYVSPSVWAWRQKRIFKIAKATNLVLAFMPFEKAFYDKYQVPCRFIGHTMADDIPLLIDKVEACKSLGLDANKQYLALLPGSRSSEVEFLSKPFLETAKLLNESYPDVEFLVPLVNQKRAVQFETIVNKVAPNLVIHTFDNKPRAVMQAATATLLASGTAALEAMLCKSPIVVGYKMKPLTYRIAQRLVKTDYISIPNLLANEMLIPEFIQDECNPQNLFTALSPYFSDDNAEKAKTVALKEKFIELHQLLRCNADEQAAQAVEELLNATNS